MKGKNTLSENATKGDILNLRQELKQEMHGLKEEIVSEIDGKNEKYKDEVMTKLDDIGGQLEDLQQDKTLSIHQTEGLREEVEGHEKRITLLESAK